MDVKSAYINADIDCENFIEQPAGFANTGSKGETLVCRLKKSLYGLRVVEIGKICYTSVLLMIIL